MMTILAWKFAIALAVAFIGGAVLGSIVCILLCVYFSKDENMRWNDKKNNMH